MVQTRKPLRAVGGFRQELVKDLWSYRLQEGEEFALGNTKLKPS